MNTLELIEHITALLHNKDKIIIGIDGLNGAGKSTISDEI